jgi:hypothetical protein
MNLNATRSRAMTILLAVGVLTVFAPPSSAVVIDFESLATSGSGATGVGITFTEDGFTFTTNAQQFGSVQTGSPNFAGSTGLFNNGAGATTTLTKSGGGSFDLTAISLSELILAQNPASVTFTGITAVPTTVIQTFNVSNFGFLPFVFIGFDDVVSVSWLQGPTNFHQFDNLFIDQPLPAPGTVPEPTAALLLAGGLGAMAAGAWRRRRAR